MKIWHIQLNALQGHFLSYELRYWHVKATNALVFGRQSSMEITYSSCYTYPTILTLITGVGGSPRSGDENIRPRKLSRSA